MRQHQVGIPYVEQLLQLHVTAAQVSNAINASRAFALCDVLIFMTRFACISCQAS